MEFYIILYIYTHARIYACMCVRNTPTFPLFRQLQQRMAPPRTRRHTQQPPVCAEANISINNAGRNPDGVGEARRAASAERKWTRGERPTLLRSPPTNKSFTRREERKREERLFPRKGKRDEEKKRGNAGAEEFQQKRGVPFDCARARVIPYFFISLLLLLLLFSYMVGFFSWKLSTTVHRDASERNGRRRKGTRRPEWYWL